MATRLVMRGALHSFLQTYTSRNADFCGYWLWGQLADALGDLQFDLLATPDTAGTPKSAAHRLAVAAFAQQVKRAGGLLSRVALARVRVVRLPGVIERTINGLPRAGSWFRFEAPVVADTGRQFVATRQAFVAPHYANGEYRRAQTTG